MKPKVLVGCPTAEMYKYCINEYINAVKSLSYSNYDILLVDNSKTDSYFKLLKSKGIEVIRDSYLDDVRERIVHSRNLLRDIAIERGYDYLFSLEQDVIPPKDAIEKLLRHNKRIVSGIYYKMARVIIKNKENETIGERKDIVPMLYKYVPGIPDRMRSCTAEDARESRFFEVRMCGMGCLLVHMGILEKINFRYEKESKGFDDTWFCKDAIDKGFRIYTDTEVKCKHLLEGKNWDIFKMYEQSK